MCIEGDCDRGLVLEKKNLQIVDCFVVGAPLLLSFDHINDVDYSE